jgi:dephospho-CoA kinase
MYLIGLTGNFGTGKTTVSKILAQLGASIINTDELGHQILGNNYQVRGELVAAFGQEIMNTSGGIDRKRLGEVAFKSERGASLLNQIMHPRITEAIREKIEAYTRDNKNVVVIEATLIDTNYWIYEVNEMWVTTAPQDVIINRLKGERGYDETEVLARLRRQVSPKDIINLADVLIATNCNLEELKNKVTGLWQQLNARIPQCNGGI